VSDTTNSDDATFVVPLYVEEVGVALRKVQTAAVNVHVTTSTREQIIDEMLTHERVEVERVAIGRQVSSVPPVREEGDTTIISIVEEVVVVERRLILKEEVRLRRVQTTERHRETVVLREQDAVVDRVEVGVQATRPPATIPA